MPESRPVFYLEPGAKLSQGDLVKNIPWGLIPDPVNVCRPKSPADSEGPAFYAPPDRMKRGGAAFAGGRQEIIHATGYVGMALVLWEDCEIDKFENKNRPPETWFVAIAPVLPATKIPPNIFEGIRAGERAQHFHLPALAAKGLDESYADLRMIWSVRQSLLADRVVTLSDTVRSALHEHLFWFFTGKRLRDKVLCTHCLETLSASDLFEVAQDEERK